MEQIELYSVDDEQGKKLFYAKIGEITSPLFYDKDKAIRGALAKLETQLPAK